MDAFDRILAAITIRDNREDLERAVGWVVITYHRETPEDLRVFGTWQEPAAALERAALIESELNVEGEEGFRCRVFPLLPPWE